MACARFSICVTVSFVILAALTYFPVWQGKVPFPRDIFYYFAAYQDSPKAEPTQPLADIGDLATSFYLFHTLAHQSVSQGTVPLWNPYILSGAPFLGHSQSALFYPPNVVSYVLPLPLAWTVSLLLRMFLAGLFMALLVRSMGGTTSGAILAGIVFSACGVITAWQGYSRGDTAIWLPLICYAVVLLRRNPSGGTVAFTALAFAIPVLAGHPETAVHITMVGVALALTLWPVAADDRTPGMKFILLFGVAGILALGLSSIQLIPTVEFLRLMPSRFNQAWPTHPISQALGLVSRDIMRSPNSGGVAIPEGAAYLGMISLLLASLAPFSKVKRYAIFFVVITVVAFAVVYSVPPMPSIVAHTPLKILKNYRMILIGSFGVAALAGLGLSSLEQETAFFKDRRARNLALIAFGVVLVLTFLLVYTLQNHTGMKVEFMRRPSFSRALLVIGAVPIFLRLTGRFHGPLFPIFMCVFAAFDLATFSSGYTGFARPHEIFPNRTVFDFLKQQGRTDSFRIAQLGGSYPVNAPMMYGLSSADGYEILTERPRNFALGLTEDLGNAISMTAGTVFATKDRRIDLLNVKYFVVPEGSQDFQLLSTRSDQYPMRFKNGHVAVFENRRVLPRAFAVPVSGIEVIENPPRNLDRVRDPSFDPQKNVVLSAVPSSVVAGRGAAEAAFHQSVEILSSDVNGYQFRVRVSEPSVLVVSQTYYPGWKARVDGKDAPVYEADNALAGIPVPAGEHDVQFRMEPTTFRIGAWITLFSTLVVAALAFVRK